MDLINRSIQDWHSEVLLSYTEYGHIFACQGGPAMPNSTFVEIPPEEQAQMLAALRRARYGDLLALHILL
jgi:hypothetical protein